MKYTNPRMSATIPDWPSGRHRVTATFEIEQDSKRGERAVRTTDGAPKKLTFAKMARIVDGDDGRTYIAELTAYGFISIMRGDMKFQQETIPTKDPRYAEALELFAMQAADTAAEEPHAYDPADTGMGAPCHACNRLADDPIHD